MAIGYIRLIFRQWESIRGACLGMLPNSHAGLFGNAYQLLTREQMPWVRFGVFGGSGQKAERIIDLRKNT